MATIRTEKDLTRIFKESNDEKPSVDVVGICRGLVYFSTHPGTCSSTMHYSCFLELEDKKYLPIHDSHAELNKLKILKLSSEVNKRVTLYGFLDKDAHSEKPYLNCEDINLTQED